MRKSLLTLLTLILSVAIYSCGGGGDSSPTTQIEPVVQNQAQIAETSSKGVYEITSSVLEFVSFTQGFSGILFDDSASLTVKRSTDIALSFKSYLATETEDCDGGGFVKGRETTSGYYLEFYNCVTEDNGIKEVLNGSLNVNLIDNSFSIETNNFSIKQYTSGNKLIDDIFMNGKLYGKVIKGTCSYLNEISANFSYSYKYDFNLDGKFDIDYKADYTNFNMNLSNVSLNKYCEINAFKSTVKSDSKANIKNNINGDFISYSVPSNSNLTIEMTYDGRFTNFRVTGSCSIYSPCLQGIFDYTTLKSISIEDGKICPTDGILKVAGTSNMTMTYTATGGIQIDYKSDGTTDYTFANCQEARVCRQ